jgi:N-acylneuraminate cytidylyltransferase
MDALVHSRPADLAGPHSQIEEAIAHWMHRCDPVLNDEDVIALLQPTSPFRKPATVRECVRLVRAGYDSVTTVTLDHRNTGRLRSYKDGTALVRWNRPVDSRPRSQDARRLGVENGCVWAFSAAHFRRTKLRQGGREAAVVTSWLEAFEVDTVEDLEIARALAGVADG